MNCPCCQQPVDLKKHRGLAINRSAYLRSQLIALEQAYARAALFVPKKSMQATEAPFAEQTARLLTIRTRIIMYEDELKRLKEFL